MAWFKNLTIQNPSQGEDPLPDVSSSPTDDEVREYARRTWVADERVRNDRWRARSYAAFVIRHRDGRKWGVLVLDSIEPGGVDLRRIRGKEFAADMLADIIQAWSDL